MGSIVSPLLGRLEANNLLTPRKEEIKSEMGFLKTRERVCRVVVLSSLALMGLVFFGLIGGGAFLLGALTAIVLVGALYANLSARAQKGLTNRMANHYPEEGVPSPKHSPRNSIDLSAPLADQ